MDVGIRTLAEQDINTLATSQNTQLGAVGVTADGRKFRYVKFGGTSTIAPGFLLVAPAVTANYQALAITASGTGAQVSGNLSAGSTQIVITNGATAITQDQFAEGYIDLLVGGSSTGVTATYTIKVKGNTAAAASATFTVYLAEALRNTTALVPGTDTANLYVSQYSGCAASVTPNVPVGVTVISVPNTSSVTNYGWVQTGGACDVINDGAGAITVGGGFAQSNTASSAGYVIASTASTLPAIGYMRKAATAAVGALPAFLKID